MFTWQTNYNDALKILHHKLSFETFFFCLCSCFRVLWGSMCVLKLFLEHVCLPSGDVGNELAPQALMFLIVSFLIDIPHVEHCVWEGVGVDVCLLASNQCYSSGNIQKCVGGCRLQKN